MAEDRLDKLAEDVRRLIDALGEVVRERDALRRQVAELRQRADTAPGVRGEESPASTPAAVSPTPTVTGEGDDALMEHIEVLESERAEIRARLTRLLRQLEEIDLVE